MCLNPFPAIEGEGKKTNQIKKKQSKNWKESNFIFQFCNSKDNILPTSTTYSEVHCYFVLFPISQEALLPHSRETAYGRKILAVQPETTALFGNSSRSGSSYLVPAIHSLLCAISHLHWYNCLFGCSELDQEAKYR